MKKITKKQKERWAAGREILQLDAREEKIIHR